MKLHLKSHSVNLSGLSLEMIKAVLHAARVWQLHGMSQLTITSANDGTHKPGSKHYDGDAVDLRTWSLPDLLGMADQLRQDLGPDYDVVIEQDHLHIEYDPKN